MKGTHQPDTNRVEMLLLLTASESAEEVMFENVKRLSGPVQATQF